MSKAVKYSMLFGACRDVGHQWDYLEWFHGKRTLICDNCGTRRYDEIDHRGRITKRMYVYPKGYMYAMKSERIAIYFLRLQLAREARKLDRWAGKKPQLHLVHKRA